jgi:hypothetical protein
MAYPAEGIVISMWTRGHSLKHLQVISNRHRVGGPSMTRERVPVERGIPARRIENSVCTAEAVALSFVRGTAPLLQLLLRNENKERSLG